MDLFSRLFKSLTATALSLALVALSPGILPYKVFAQSVPGLGLSQGQGRQVIAVPAAAPGSVSTGFKLELGPSLITGDSIRRFQAAPIVSVSPAKIVAGAQAGAVSGVSAAQGAAPTIDASPARGASAPRVQSGVSPKAAPLAVAPSLELGAAPLKGRSDARGESAWDSDARSSERVGAISRRVGSTLEKTGPISQVGSETAFAAGLEVESALTGARAGVNGALEDLAQTSVMEFQSGLGWNHQLARPAGQEIAESVRSHNESVSAPAPQLTTEKPRQAERKSPLVPRLIASGLALLPAALLGVPLLAAGSLVAGGALIASSLALSALPFMSERTAKAVRSVPGAALFSLGAVTLAAGALSGAGLWMGALVTLGGWGLWRYGRSESVKHSYEEAEALSAFFGALGAAAGAGLVLLSPAGWLAGALTWLAYPTAALLLMHLPSWVGNGIVAVFSSARQSVRGTGRVMFSIRNDTVLRERLDSFTKRHLDRSPWNAVWLAGVWIPVWLSDLGQFALAIAGGLAVSAMQAPMMFLWGVSHELAQQSAVTKFLAAWAHFSFDNAQGSKKILYNRIVTPLASYANSKNKAVSWPAAAAMRLAQWAWLAYAVLGTPVLMLAGLIRAFTKTGEAYDAKKHDPDYLRVSTEDKIGTEPAPEEPEDPAKPVKDPVAPKIIAAGIALVPGYFIGLPLLASAGPVLGGIYLVSVAALAAMPFMPENTPKLVRQLPGFLLTGLGLTMFYLMPVIPFTLAAGLALLKTNAFWMASVAALSGWGLIRYAGRPQDLGGGTSSGYPSVGKAGKSEGRKYSVDDPEYIGAFFGALGVGTGVGITLLGLSGWVPMGLTALAYLTSPLLLMHLPSSIWAGAYRVLRGIPESARAFHDVLGFWHNETKFHSNLKSHARYWLKKSVWNGTWLSLLWVPTWGVMAAEVVLSLGLGLAMSLLRAPFNFIAGASREISRESKVTKFIEGFAKGTFKRMEGNFDLFKRETSSLVPMMEESHPVSGRPTAKAFLAAAVLRLAQFAWLARMVFFWPAALILALNDAYTAAAAAADKAE